MPLDHISLTVPASKFEDVITFLNSSLGHLGFKEYFRPQPGLIGMGDETPYFWISTCLPKDADEKTIEGMLGRNHIAFTAKSVEEVKKFHEEALKAGGKCNGPPGPRPQYHPAYYGAFVRDPACNINFEVVYHSYSAAE